MDNGRYGGGVAGPETRYHRPAVDTDQFEDATEGSTVKSPQHANVPERVAAAKINTMDGPGRGSVAGASYPNSKGQDGFC